MRRIATDIAVVGAGPAGLSAAIAAAGAGATVDVIDAGFRPGGQYWMQDPAGDGPVSAQAAEGRAAIGTARSAGVRFHMGAELWAAFPDLRLSANSAEGPFELQARAIIVASGAQDRVMAFPGWTLPGVMTPGAAQRLVKLGKTAPGKRILLAGDGPFLYAVAETLQGVGATPVLMLEASHGRFGMVAHLARHPERWREAFRLALAARAIPDRRRGFVVTEALGTDHVTAVRIAPLSADGTADLARSEVIAGIDTLLVGWGFRPMIEVTALLRCRHDYDRDKGGWFCVAEAETGRTSVANVYAAGEATGVAGALPARLSGEIAGLSAATGLGFTVSGLAGRRAALLRRLSRARAFAEGLGPLSPPPSGLVQLCRDDTIVCRCEEVTKGDIRAALAAGTTAVAGAKLWTRAGMGRCQGRSCGWAVAEIAARETGMSAEDAGVNPPRIPLRPVPLPAVLAAMEDPS